MRATASRIADTFLARTVLSTTRSSAQDTAHDECFGRAKVEIFENSGCLAVHERGVVLLHNQAAVPKDTVGNRRGRVVEDEQIHGVSCGTLETRHEIPQLQCSELRGVFQADGNVNIDLAYTTFGGVRLVFGTDDTRLARELLDQ